MQILPHLPAEVPVPLDGCSASRVLGPAADWRAAASAAAARATGVAGAAPFIFQFFSALSFLFPCHFVHCCLDVVSWAQAAAYAPDPLPVSWSHSPVR